MATLIGDQVRMELVTPKMQHGEAVAVAGRLLGIVGRFQTAMRSS